MLVGGGLGTYKSDFIIVNTNVQLVVDDLPSSFLWFQSTQITTFPSSNHM